MGKYIIVFTLTLLASGWVQAQELTKSEKKELLKELKAMKKKPELLRDLKERAEVMDVVATEQSIYIMKIDNVNEQLTYENKSLKGQLQEANGLLNNTNEDCVLDEEGMKYRVQVGLYRDFDITGYLDKPKFFIYEKVGDLYRYSIGNFESKQSAQNFVEEIRSMGIKDAFVSEYFDGNRNIE